MDRAGTITDEVVVAAAGGSGPAVARLAEALEPQIGLMVMARLHAGSLDLHSVEEVAQSSLVALAAGIHRLQNRTSAGLKVYLSGIVSRQVRDFLRHKPGRERGGPRFASLDSTVFGQSGAGPLHQFLAAQGTAPDDAVERADRLAIVFSALSKLKPHYRRVIILAFFDQLPMPEIGEQLGVSRAAASMLLLRAVKTLRRDLTGSSQIGLGDGHLQRE